MIPVSLEPLANHLWQSTLFAAVAALLTVALRRNRAQIRYGVWMVASVKFLVPFAWFVSAGTRLDWRPAHPVASPLTSAIGQIGLPFRSTASPAAVAGSAPLFPALPALLAAIWLCGILALFCRWWTGWRRIRRVVRQARRLPIDAPVPVVSAPTRLEPGVFGVLRPVLLLPEGISERLLPSQLQAIVAHELCHLRRWDNGYAAIHMLVEALFWFHPLVWWIGARLVEERERACDEEVPGMGSEPEDYASGIVNVCKLYLESPLTCASGVTGADLKKRIEGIMSNRILTRMTLARKSLLAAAAVAAVAGPFAFGILNAPLMRAQTEVVPALRFEVASIKPTGPAPGRAGMAPLPGGGFRAEGITVQQLVTFAYEIQENQLSGGPGWIRTEGYEILAKPEKAEDTNRLGWNSFDRLRMRMRTLLAERFGLVIHKDSKEAAVFVLTVAKGGHKLQASKEQGNPRMMRSHDQLDGNRATMKVLASLFANWMGRPVVDRTGLTGTFDFKVKYAPESSPQGPEGAEHPPAGAPESTGPSIFTALQEQLGLKLESTRGPLETIVIDKVEKPSAN